MELPYYLPIMVFVLQLSFIIGQNSSYLIIFVLENDIIFIGLKPFHMTKWLLTDLGIEYIFIVIFSCSSMFLVEIKG